MSYDVVVIPNFRKEIKRLAKKYPSIKSDFAALIEELTINPVQGVPLGKNCFKIRMSITSKGKGKSGGARVITYVHIVESTVYLLSVFDKSDKESISDDEIRSLLEFIE